MTKNNSKPIIWIITGLLVAIVLVGAGLSLGWYLRQQEDNSNPYQVLKGYESSRHGFMVKSAELSVKMADRAVKALKNENVNEAIEDCRIAIDLFPVDAKPYILLTKLYLMTGQERKMYDTLTLAGRSYPNFDNIIGIIDDENLDKIPLDEPKGKVYLSNFPGNRAMAVAFMFDDGESNVYKALPAFESYGYKATIPIVAGFVADKSNDPFWGSWAEWKDAASRGFEIANHSMFHRDSKDLHGSEFDVAIDQSQKMIEENVGHPVVSYVFPHDSYTAEAVARALRTHKAVRTPEFLHTVYHREVEIVLGGPHVSISTAKRMIDIGMKRRLWLIEKCHGVTDKRTMRSFKSISPEFLESLLAYIHAQNNAVWVDTFFNQYSYESMRARTVIEIKNMNDQAIDFVLHGPDPQARLSVPLTVVINIKDSGTFKSATSAGHDLKAWNCAPNALCVDVPEYEDIVHVQ